MAFKTKIVEYLKGKGIVNAYQLSVACPCISYGTAFNIFAKGNEYWPRKEVFDCLHLHLGCSVKDVIYLEDE